MVELSTRIQDRGQQLFVLAGILAFTDKIIDEEEANKIRRTIEMTKVGMIIEREKQQAVEQAVEKAKELERKKITETVELLLETKNKELAEKDSQLEEKDSQYQKELAEKESRYQQELAKLRAHIAELESAMK